MSFHPESLIKSLNERARDIRIDSIEMIYRRNAGHPGGSLSCADIMAALFFYKLRIDPDKPDWSERDRFILSKGHASAALYSALSMRGFFPREDLTQWGAFTCHLQGHPDCRKTPGVDMTTGILGHGIAVGAGLALASRLDDLKNRVYVLLGDGECQGGIVWEGALVAAKYHLANLTAIVDYNDVQLDGPVHEILPLEPFIDKWRAFNWAVLEINGHNLREILEALDMAGEIHDRPTIIIARTTKGKGVSFMENTAAWHGVPPDESQYRRAIVELNGGAQ
jgi:transketolase